jgi:molybdate transport system ATP-binding protein
MSLHASLGVRRGEHFTLDLTLTAAPGETVALLGPNGAGKTTALRALAGLQPLTTGSITLDGRVLDDPAAGVLVATERRPIGVVFQDYLLFAHLSALENVAFGPRARGVDRATARLAAASWLERVGLARFAGRRPGALSGGQAQRVALARALVTRPRLLLLDEPLAALDASTRLSVRGELRRHLADYPGIAVLVTHDPLDAMVLADRLVVLEGGHVVQEGTPAEVAHHPRTDYVARLVGLNLYRGTATPNSPDNTHPQRPQEPPPKGDTHAYRPGDAGAGSVVRLAGGGSLVAATLASGQVLVAFPPTAVSLHPTRPHGSPRNTWSVRLTTLEQHGGTVRVRLTGPPDVLADVTPAAVADLGLHPGVTLWATVKATEIRVYPV